MAGALDGDVGDVAADGGRPAPDLGHLEHDVEVVHVVAHLLGPAGAAGRQHEHRAADVEAALQLGVAASDGAQPAEGHRERVDRLPVGVERPLAVVVGVQAATVVAADGARDQPGRLPGADLLDDRRAQTLHQAAALHVEPGGVQHHAREGGLSLVGPQRHDQAAGGVGADHDVVVTVALGDPLEGGVEVGEVGAQVGDVVGRLVRPDRTTVLAQVDRVEVVAALGPPLGVVGLEEVVAEAVHVEDGATGGLRRTSYDEGRDDRSLLVGRQ